MVFSSVIFLFLFLPVVLTLGTLLPGLRPKNLFLLAASLVFYAWGEPGFVWLLLASTAVNFLFGKQLETQTAPLRRNWILGIAVTFNLGFLAFFKYSQFLLQNLNVLLDALRLPLVAVGPTRLPLGISFFTFHAISYVVDIYRGNAPAARKPSTVALYIFLFPQLIAGPILRWSAMAPQYAARALDRERFVEGIRRFVYGLAKKVLVANTLAVPANQVFSLASGVLSPGLAWLGLLCYTLQIYFDFSGYSDMAIGLGKMFGFDFIENFRYPYVSQSIREFWRRWHISLSTWFRDYLYFPLGGNRGSSIRTGFNLFLVFLLCGLWHGTSWTFVIWGAYYGVFLVLERTRFGGWLQRLPRPLRHLYVLLLVMLGWVFFRADTLPHALTFLRALFGFTSATAPADLLYLILTNQVLVALYVGIVFSTPFAPWLREELRRLLRVRLGTLAEGTRLVSEPVVLIGLLLLSAAWLADGTYNPFIYFRF